MVTSDRSTNECLFPHSMIHFAFGISALIIFTCALFIYFFAADFGPDLTKRWMLSLFISIIVSILFLEPLKILFFSLCMAIRKVQFEESFGIIRLLYIYYNMIHKNKMNNKKYKFKTRVSDY